MILTIENNVSCLLSAILLLFPLTLLKAEDTTATAGRETLNRAVKHVERIRGRRFTRPVATGKKTTEEIAAFLKEQFDKDLPGPLLSLYTAVYREFNLIPEGYNLKKGLISLLTEQIGGFYDPEEKKFYLAEKSAIFGEMITAHELTHALQDCYIPLGRTLACEDLGFSACSPVRNDDIYLARLCFFEGEAQMVMSKYVELGHASVTDISVKDIINMMFSQLQMNCTPPAISDQLMYPYITGHSFINSFYARNRWKSVNRMYSRLPRSSEQISHPEKYIQGDDPIFIIIDGLEDLEKKGWAKKGETSMGEFMTYQVIKSLTGDFAKGIRASCGWGGDTLYMYAKDGNSLTVWYSTWDTDKDNDEFFGFLREGVGRPGHGPHKVIHEGDSFRGVSHTGAAVSIRKTARDAVYISCTDSTLLEKTDTYLTGIRHLTWNQRFPDAHTKRADTDTVHDKGDVNE